VPPSALFYLLRSNQFDDASLSETANAAGEPLISRPNSRVSVCIISTNEELMIAQYTLALIKARGSNHVQVD
jgi:acetate kinase